MAKKKLPFFQFYPKDWLVDLAEHPLEIEGAWIRICSYLWEAEERGKLAKRLAQWARILGVSIEKAFEILSYIQAEKIGNISPDLTESNGLSNADPNAVITVVSRRIYNDEKEREKNRLRFQRHYKKRKANEDLTDDLTANEQGFSENLTPPSYHISYCTSTSSYEDVSGAMEDDRSGMPAMPKKLKSETSDQYHERYMGWAEESLGALSIRKRDRWAEAYPAVDLEREVAKALDWLDSNPKKRKKDISGYMSRWLSRAQEQGGNRPRSRARSPDRPGFEERARNIYETVSGVCEGRNGEQESHHQGVIEAGRRIPATTSG